MTTRETAALLGCHPKSVYALVDLRVIAPVRLTGRPKSRLRFDRLDVEELIQSRKGAA